MELLVRRMVADLDARSCPAAAVGMDYVREVEEHTVLVEVPHTDLEVERRTGLGAGIVLAEERRTATAARIGPEEERYTDLGEGIVREAVDHRRTAALADRRNPAAGDTVPEGVDHNPLDVVSLVS